MGSYKRNGRFGSEDLPEALQPIHLEKITGRWSLFYYFLWACVIVPFNVFIGLHFESIYVCSFCLNICRSMNLYKQSAGFIYFSIELNFYEILFILYSLNLVIIGPNKHIKITCISSFDLNFIVRHMWNIHPNWM